MKRFFSYFFFFSVMACNGQREYKSPKGYDFLKYEKVLMPEVLLEISGIAFGPNSKLYGVQDEEGKLFRVPLKKEALLSSKFGKKGDYEDVAFSGNYTIVLRSDGVLFSFPVADLEKKSLENVHVWEGLLPKGEYEGLFATGNGDLYALCKECASDKGGKLVTGYRLQVSAQGDITTNGSFEIHVKEIKELAKKEKLNFRPSALAQHPQTKDWYIISSVSKLLVVTDAQWKVKEVCFLDPVFFLQPEGIAFDEHHNLYISNEGDNISNGNILKFSYQTN